VYVPPNRIVDKTGAGDAYAAGVLCAIAQDIAPGPVGKDVIEHYVEKHGSDHALPIHRAGELGSQWAAETIKHLGARRPGPVPVVDMSNYKGKQQGSDQGQSQQAG
jgi:sugar/nucleoside kinase (ribokinase family)